MKLINLLYNPRIKRLVVRNRGRSIAKWLDDFAIRYHRVYENHNYKFEENGEPAVLQRLQKTTSIKTIFDVGANIGDWTLAVSTMFPQAQVFTFEISPRVFKQLAANTTGLTNVRILNTGLSDREGEIYLNFVSGNSALSSCLDSFSEEFHRQESTKERCVVTTGDLFCSQNSISQIDFLKIDVEGLEPNVLRGFGNLLERKAIRIIQFEYGYTSLSSRFLLKDFYEFFARYEMTVGKIYPNGVDFSEYNYFKEDFIGPNFLAVRSDEKNIIENLRHY